MAKLRPVSQYAPENQVNSLDNRLQVVETRSTNNSLDIISLENSVSHIEQEIQIIDSRTYDDLNGRPIINQDLHAIGFQPVANTYYRHTGDVQTRFTKGIIYKFNGEIYEELGSSTSYVHCYSGTISPADWSLQGEFYYYIVSHNSHNLSNPVVDVVLSAEEGGEGYENAFETYTVLPNDDIRFKASSNFACKFRLSGDR